MTTDNTVVQLGTVPPEGTVPPAVATPPEPSPEEKIAALIERKVTEAIAVAIEPAKREIQSVKDKATREVADAQRRARASEGTLTAVYSHLKTVDPEVAKELELAELRAKEQGRLTMEQEEVMTKQQLEFHQQFHSNLTQFITGLGVDPADKRIDWAGNAPNYLEAQQRVLDSVAKIQKETIQTTQSGWEKRLKDLEDKVKQANVEANTVDTTTSPGVVAGSDAEFLRRFASGDIPLTKENVDRYNKIQSSY